MLQSGGLPHRAARAAPPPQSPTSRRPRTRRRFGDPEVVLADFIYTMKDLRKVVPPNRVILKGIWLSFFYGRQDRRPRQQRRRQVVAAHASWPASTTSHLGEAQLAKGIQVGYLPQEPQLDPTKTVLEQRRGGGRRDQGAARRVQRHQREVRRADGRRRDGEAARAAGQAAGQDRGGERVGSRPQARDRDGRAALPAARRRRDEDLGRRAPPRRAVPPAAVRARHAAARRADEPPRRRVRAWLERYLQEYKGTVVAVTHDRYFLDNVAGWILELDRGEGIPYEGNYSSWLEQKQARLEQEEKTASARRKTLERELEWVRMTPKARQAKSKARLSAYEKMLAEEQKAQGRERRDLHPARPAPGRRGHRGGQRLEGVRRSPADRGSLVQAAARAASSASSAPTAPARRRCSR